MFPSAQLRMLMCTIQTGSEEKSKLHIAEHYAVSVNCGLFSWSLHFASSSDKSGNQGILAWPETIGSEPSASKK